MRNFFEHQDAARRISGRLAVTLAGAVVGTILATAIVFAGVATLLAFVQVSVTTTMTATPEYWLGVFANCFCVAMFVAGGIFLCVALPAAKRGGAELASEMGGTRVLTIGKDPKYQQLINVVEELSIATSSSPPKIYVLEDEEGINAFAAGIEPRDTVVGLTRGALEHFGREQLQGVLAHEFSHIVNGDVRMNCKTLGALRGIEAIASAARYLLRMGASPGVNGSMIPLAFGFVLWPVGQIGVLFASIVRMSLNRQREFLADAAAVQFTRYPEGLSSALKLIAGHAHHGRIQSAAAQSSSHLFFAEGASPLGRLLMSHPPLEVRIRRLDPQWDGVLPTFLPAELAAALEQVDQEPLHVEVEAALPGPTQAIASGAKSQPCRRRSELPRTMAAFPRLINKHSWRHWPAYDRESKRRGTRPTSRTGQPSPRQPPPFSSPSSYSIG